MGRVLYKIMLLLSVLLSRLRRENVLERTRVRRILVVELTKLGDLLSNLPLFSVLKDLFPRASITVMVQPEYAGLFSLIPEVEEVLTSIRSWRLKDFFKSIREIRRHKFDFVLSPSPSARQGVLVLLSGAKYRFGYLDYTRARVVHLQPHRIRALGFQLPDAVYQPVVNITDRVSRLCTSLGAKNPDGKPILSFLREGSVGQNEAKAALELTNGTPYIVIHPFAGWSYRTWALENFRHLIHRILESFPHRILIVGAESDRQGLQSLVEEFSQHSRVVFGMGLPLDKLAAVVAGAALFIGSDSGPLHLASAVGTPVIGLFGPAPPGLTGPPSQLNTYLYKKVECSPCDQQDCVRKWAPCITLISVEEVFENVKRSRLAGDEPLLRQVAWPRTV